MITPNLCNPSDHLRTSYSTQRWILRDSVRVASVATGRVHWEPVISHHLTAPQRIACCLLKPCFQRGSQPSSLIATQEHKSRISPQSHCLSRILYDRCGVIDQGSISHGRNENNDRFSVPDLWLYLAVDLSSGLNVRYRIS